MKWKQKETIIDRKRSKLENKQIEKKKDANGKRRNLGRKQIEKEANW